MGYSVDISELPGVIAKDIRKKRERLLHGVRRMAQLHLPRLIVQEIMSAKPRPPVDRGAILRWETKDIPEGVLVFNSQASAYADVIVGKGRRPGARMPPVAAIEAWVKRKMRGEIMAGRKEARSLFSKGVDKGTRKAAKKYIADAEAQTIHRIAFLIARKIASRGWPSPPNQPMRIMANAMAKFRPLLHRSVHRILRGEEIE